MASAGSMGRGDARVCGSLVMSEPRTQALELGPGCSRSLQKRQGICERSTTRTDASLIVREQCRSRISHSPSGLGSPPAASKFRFGSIVMLDVAP